MEVSRQSSAWVFKSRVFASQCIYRKPAPSVFENMVSTHSNSIILCWHVLKFDSWLINSPLSLTNKVWMALAKCWWKCLAATVCKHLDHWMKCLIQTRWRHNSKSRIQLKKQILWQLSRELGIFWMNVWSGQQRSELCTILDTSCNIKRSKMRRRELSAHAVYVLCLLAITT